MGRFFRIIIVCVLLVFSFLFLPDLSFAASTPFRSARIVTTDSFGFLAYTNLDNCSATDGKTCDRATATLTSNLYFRDFGNYDDFGIPQGSIISKVRIRVTGKASESLFVGLSYGTTFQFNCQWPSDLWILYQLNGSTINTQTFTAPVVSGFSPGAVQWYCLQPYAFENKSFIWVINYTSFPQNWSANIDNFEIAFDYEAGATPTPTPTATPTATPTPTPPPGPEPFLDLPWDYEGRGLSFNEAALSINSYFDHEYPLLGSGLSEPAQISDSIINFQDSSRKSKPYSSHDGYDYGNPAQVHNGDPVFAAASGVATYVNSCRDCGNMIVIDHGNGYQTRYLHLQGDGLITNIPGQKISINARQQIGRVGATGNVFPSGDQGAHIHFGVFEDKNKDGSFDDNVPDGVTDPFGWQSKDPDPWPAFVFDYGGQRKTGNRSYYLWNKKIDKLDATLTANGAVFNTERFRVEFPQDATSQNLTVNLQSAPLVNALNNLSSIGSSIIITAFDSLGNLVTNFQNLFNITVDFSSFDLTRYKTETLSFYSSSDGTNWTKEPTIVDYFSNTATTQIGHLTQFALMAERRDTISPTTTATISGQQGQQNWYRSDVGLNLNAQDNEGGLGVDYTLYKIETNENTTDWVTYETPLTFTAEGHHKIEFYSVDKDENVEEVKSVEFDIDKTIPEAKIFIDQDKQDLVVEGIDQNKTTVEKKDNVETKKKDDAFYNITDQAGNTTKLDVRDRDKEKKDKFKIYSIQYNQEMPIEQPDNHYNVKYKGKKDKLNVSEQNFAIKKEIRIRIKYNGKKNQSTITTRVNGQEKVKETRDGLVLLQLTTEKGTLKYSY